MQSTLNPAQLAQALRRTPVATAPLTAKTVARFSYDPDQMDDVLDLMFGRRWDVMDSWPPRTTSLWSALNSCTLGRSLDGLDEVRMLQAVAENTKSAHLRYRAIAGLQAYLADCSSISTVLKPEVQRLLESLNAPLIATVPTKEELEQRRNTYIHPRTT